MSRASIKKNLSVLALLATPFSTAIALSMGASYDESVWKVSSSIFECRLEHEITGYGRITFSKYAGYPEKSELDIWSLRSIPQLPAKIDFVSPPWINEHRELEGWTFYFGEQRRPVDFSARDSRKILDSLRAGFMPIIKHKHNSNRTQDIVAQISPVNFSTGYDEYTYCLGSMLPYSYEELRVSDIFFATASSRIDSEMMELLGYVIEYAKDPDVHRIELSGYTDSVGSFRANHQLASHRVEAVRDYLVKNGISEKIIRLKVHGEQGAKSRNDTTYGRSQNRRVEVKLHR